MQPNTVTRYCFEIHPKYPGIEQVAKLHVELQDRQRVIPWEYDVQLEIKSDHVVVTSAEQIPDDCLDRLTEGYKRGTQTTRVESPAGLERLMPCTLFPDQRYDSGVFGQPKLLRHPLDEY